MNTKKSKKILFVCTGNSCRSIMAEGILKKALQEKKREGIEVYSAGTKAIGGLAPMDNTIKVMQEKGIDVTSYKTAKLTPDMIKEADLVLTMDNIHYDKVLDYVPEAKDKTHLLRKYVNNKDNISGFDIPDPIGLPLEIYERVFSILKEAITKLVERL